jgi:GDPmannose 4,6-dehydratase
MVKRALISGIAGQDGSYLADLLLKKGYKVFGGLKSPQSDLWRLKELNISHEIEFVPFNLLDSSAIESAIKIMRPDEVFNLASQSSVAHSFENPIFTQDINSNGPLRILNALKKQNKEIKFFQASSSEMFGQAQDLVQNESSPFSPQNPYAISKLAAHWMTVHYRKAYNIFSCSGILYNHESPLRGEQFVTRKVIQSVAKIKFKKVECLELGNLAIKKDWGHAKDFVEGMWLTLQQKRPDDYIFATGQLNSLKSFVEMAFQYIGIDIIWDGEKEKTVGLDKKTKKVLVKSSKKFYRPVESMPYVGDFTKAKKDLNWRPRITFEHLVQDMMAQEMKRFDAHKNLEEFRL